jgi:membrane-bound lytic murein transglycosylase A
MAQGYPVRVRCALGAVAALCALAGCGSPSLDVSPPPSTGPAPAVERSRWVAVDWSELPGWADDRAAELWPALRLSCARPAPAWAAACAQALAAAPPDDDAARRWLATWLQPYRVEAPDGSVEGLATGYFEPQLEARRKPDARFRFPVHAPPADLQQRRPHYTRQQFDTLPAAMAALRGREIAWLDDPLDLLLLQVQGSGRLRIAAADGTAPTTVRVAFAGHNDQPYRSVGRWLVERGELRADGASWPAIRAWALQNPQRVDELLWSNPRVVFFREEPLPDPALGPRGAQGVPLTAGRSVAVDPASVPLGTPLWIATAEPLSAAPLRRLVMAQDTGGAITGAVRVDYFFGTGEAALAQAGRMRATLRVWALWPRGGSPAASRPDAGASPTAAAPGRPAAPAPPPARERP